eukprot:CAMPEP_0182417718 /NCGR_PEP_ID=MMETSP1167-20130531/2151_1 /TAXON_ID=2988 /ORGANISM="Mallomonas Sp, Strain CCMP3275" /LENGTH=505 /DNA_ID=CAMNT_0024591443 /DNA_START=179 /DNA_END=1696 /DNA_ORIENTATION=-
MGDSELTAKFIHLNTPLSLRDTTVDEVPKPKLCAVRNRRDEEPYLKNVFPSGFNQSLIRVKINRKKVATPCTKSVFTSDSSTITSRASSPSRGKHPYSFIEWTKGDNSNSDDISYDGDDYADVAGTYFKEINRNSFVPDAIPDTPIDSSNPLTIQPYNSGPQFSPGLSMVQSSPHQSEHNVRQGTVSQPKVMLSVAVLPSLQACRPNMKRSVKTSKNKASVYGHESKSHIHSHSAMDSKYTDSELLLAPQPFPETLEIEVYAFKALSEGRSVNEISSAAKRFRIHSSLPIRGLREAIYDNCADAKDKTLVQNWSQDTPEMTVMYFNMDVHAWRPLKNKVDWAAAKMMALEQEQVLQLSFSMGGSVGMGIGTAGSVLRQGGLSGRGYDSGRGTDRELREPRSSRLRRISSRESRPSEGPSRPGTGDSDAHNAAGVSKISLNPTIRSVRSTDEVDTVRFTAPNAMATPYKHKSVSYSPKNKQPMPSAAKQTELAFVLEQRLLRHRNR